MPSRFERKPIAHEQYESPGVLDINNGRRDIGVGFGS
jgi:hypothetical protein